LGLFEEVAWGAVICDLTPVLRNKQINQETKINHRATLQFLITWANWNFLSGFNLEEIKIYEVNGRYTCL
jgi:hypothetical protein